MTMTTDELLAKAGRAGLDALEAARETDECLYVNEDVMYIANARAVLDTLQIEWDGEWEWGGEHDWTKDPKGYTRCRACTLYPQCEHDYASECDAGNLRRPKLTVRWSDAE